MPSPTRFIKEASLSHYPELAACLTNEQVTIEQLNRLLENNKRYYIQLSDNLTSNALFLQILSLYGKRECIEQLALSSEQKKKRLRQMITARFDSLPKTATPLPSNI